MVASLTVLWHDSNTALCGQSLLCRKPECLSTAEIKQKRWSIWKRRTVVPLVESWALSLRRQVQRWDRGIFGGNAGLCPDDSGNRDRSQNGPFSDQRLRRAEPQILLSRHADGGDPGDDPALLFGNWRMGVKISGCFCIRQRVCRGAGWLFSGICSAALSADAVVFAVHRNHVCRGFVWRGKGNRKMQQDHDALFGAAVYCCGDFCSLPARRHGGGGLLPETGFFKVHANDGAGRHGTAVLFHVAGDGDYGHLWLLYEKRGEFGSCGPAN